MIRSTTRLSLIAATGLMLAAVPAYAQTNPSPAAPTAKGNQIPAPSATRPSDPAANDSGSARVPTSPAGGATGGMGGAAETTPPSTFPPDKSGAGGTPKTGN